MPPDRWQYTLSDNFYHWLISDNSHSKAKGVHTHTSCNAVPLVWGSLRLPSIIITSGMLHHPERFLWLHRDKFHTQTMSYVAKREVKAEYEWLRLTWNFCDSHPALIVTQPSEWHSQQRLCVCCKHIQLESSSLLAVPSTPTVVLK